ncbi:hypothetical protein PFISCL1PPCAC_26343 [Pristionchus fissidentatus]|uniref:Carboxylic ester hydrolase n=1 Tax=Pristionchus fissidentatus TaxID=1538716 RepID=A0AAV5WVE2_9BILA|nr:hypothetical protein PFISCL1PPCAC_26343 [Pristionchus fissidentatus]
MAVVHGGKFNFESPAVFPEDVIVDNFDILAGLGWIQREIHNFGGDKARVTLFGHSSGACLVDTLSLSPQARGLFTQLVIGSAASLLSNSEMNRNVNMAASWAIANQLDVLHPITNTLKTLRRRFHQPFAVFDPFPTRRLSMPSDLFTIALRISTDQRSMEFSFLLLIGICCPVVPSTQL